MTGSVLHHGVPFLCFWNVTHCAWCEAAQTLMAVFCGAANALLIYCRCFWCELGVKIRKKSTGAAGRTLPKSSEF